MRPEKKLNPTQNITIYCLKTPVAQNRPNLFWAQRDRIQVLGCATWVGHGSSLTFSFLFLLKRAVAKMTFQHFPQTQALYASESILYFLKAQN